MAAIYLLLLVTPFAFYSPTLNAYFVADDFGYIQLYMSEKLTAWPKLFAADWSQGIWGYELRELRPIIALSYMWDSSIWRINPLGYHITNVLFHALNSISVFLIARLLLRTPMAASLVAGLLFAIHPAHVEAVSWIAGRTDLISTFFYLNCFLAFGLYRSRCKLRYYVFSLIMFILGLFSKEMVISLPLMLIAYDSLRKDFKHVRVWTRELLPHAGYMAVLALYLILRHFTFTNSLAGINAIDYRVVVTRHGYYLSYLFPPIDILVGFVGGKWLLLFWIVLLSAIAVFFLVRRNSRRWASAAFKDMLRPILFFGPAWYLISIIPLFATYTAQRHVYLPSAGICIVAGLALPRLLSKRSAAIAVIMFLALYGCLLLRSNWRWREASQLSGQARAEVEALVQDIPSGSLLILNIPGTHNGVYTWAWATPFVLREPFSDFELYRRFHVLESPSNYCCPWVRDKIPVILDLVNRPVDSHLIYFDDSGRLVKRSINGAQLQSQLSNFFSIDSVKDARNRNFENAPAIHAAWESFWKAYTESQ